MAAQIRVLRRRIRSTQSIKKITRAMELIATSRIAKARARVDESKPYAQQITAVLTQLEFPVRYPTSLAFGGPDLDVLYVTSISKSVRFEDTAEGAGGSFAVEGLGVRGLAEPRCEL